MIWTCHEERPRMRRKKDDENKIAGKEEKRETKEKIFGCDVEGYGGSWCEGDRRWRKDGLKKDNTLWLHLIEGKGRKEKKKNL